MNSTDMTQGRPANPARPALSAFRRRSFAALLAVATLALVASCGKATQSTAAAPKAVHVVAAEMRDFALSSEYAARVQPSKEIAITPKVGGRVSAVRAEVGDLVSEGQVLFTIESGDYDAQFRQANAAYQSATANLTRTSDAGQGQQMLQAQAAVDQAQVSRDEAKSMYDKTLKLYQGGVIAKQQLDDVEAKYKSAEIQLGSAQQNLDIVRDKSGKQASDVVSGQVDQAKAQADLARSMLDGTVIRSPIAGRVSYRNVETGEFVGTSSLAFMVLDVSSVVADAAVSERVVGLLKVGMRVPVGIEALGDSRLEGTIEWVSPGADPRTMLYSARVRLSNATGAIKPGMIARVVLPVERLGEALLVPEKSVFSVSGGDAVFVVVDGKSSLRRIELGQSDGQFVDVRSGLKPGELVIPDGQEFLRDGESVQVQP